jgi:hypothetical protein|tara:strand:- start:192 stop:428 length:237 start_codon:yes stop_codon:yes gene_type:complete
MVEKKMIQIDKELALKVKGMYPDLSWNAIVSKLVSKDLSKDSSKDSGSTYATVDDIKVLKDKFSMVITQLIKVNKLKQ